VFLICVLFSHIPEGRGVDAKDSSGSSYTSPCIVQFKI
jgi:hypothetical protein